MWPCKIKKINDRRMANEYFRDFIARINSLKTPHEADVLDGELAEDFLYSIVSYRYFDRLDDLLTEKWDKLLEQEEEKEKKIKRLFERVAKIEESVCPIKKK